VATDDDDKLEFIAFSGSAFRRIGSSSLRVEKAGRAEMNTKQNCRHSASLH
jgi:hypothetical protein